MSLLQIFHRGCRYVLLIACIPICALALIWAAYFIYILIHPNQQVAETPPLQSPTPKAAAATIAGLKCPEDYQTGGEKMTAFNDFSNSYVIVNPNAYGSSDELIVGRADFLIKHHCTATLMRFGYDGMSPIGAQLRRQLIAAMEDALRATLQAESSSSRSRQN